MVARFEFELVYLVPAVQHFTHYTAETPHSSFFERHYELEFYDLILQQSN